MTMTSAMRPTASMMPSPASKAEAEGTKAAMKTASNKATKAATEFILVASGVQQRLEIRLFLPSRLLKSTDSPVMPSVTLISGPSSQENSAKLGVQFYFNAYFKHFSIPL